MSIERKPHKHAEVIRKWADGAQIQYSHNGVDWKDVLDNLPGFYSHTLSALSIPIASLIRWQIIPTIKPPSRVFVQVLQFRMRCSMSL